MPAMRTRTSASPRPATGSGRSETRRSRVPSQRSARTRVGRYTGRVRLSYRLGNDGTAAAHRRDRGQRKRYLGQLVDECSLAAYCITEPGAGSDLAGMATTYKRVGDEFVLNGTRHFISNGSVAQWDVAFATRDRKARHAGISAFVFPADLPGIKKHRMKYQLGQRAPGT